MSIDSPNLDKTVEELESSVRLANILDNTAEKLPEWAEAKGLPRPRVLRDLVRWSEKDFYKLAHVGKRMLAELQGLLEQQGLSLLDPQGRAAPPTAMTNPDAPSIDKPVDDLEVVKAVVGFLRPLPPVSQVRVLRAACILLGHDAIFLDDPVAHARLRTHFTKENL